MSPTVYTTPWFKNTLTSAVPPVTHDNMVFLNSHQQDPPKKSEQKDLIDVLQYDRNSQWSMCLVCLPFMSLLLQLSTVRVPTTNSTTADFTQYPFAPEAPVCLREHSKTK